MPAAPDWTKLTLALDPWAELPFDRSAERLYVDLAYSPSVHIMRRLKAWHRGARDGGRKDPPPKFLFCGARGSGKTTQLRRLVGQLGSENEVLLLDLAPVLGERASTLQLVAHVGLALLARLGQWEGADGGVARVIAGEAGSGFASILKDWVGTVDLAALVEGISPLVIAAEIAGPGAVTGAAAVVRALKAALPGLQQQLDPVQRLARAERLMRRLAGAEIEDAQTLVKQVSRLAEALHGRSSKPVVVLVDGLDKILSLEDLLVAFEDLDLLRSIEAAIVLTGPGTLSSDVRFVGMRQDLIPLDLHNIPVVSPEGLERDDGLGQMIAIATNRLAGPLEGLLDAAVLRVAARWSSGIPRDFLSLLSEAALLAEEAGRTQVTLADVQAAAKELRLKLQRPLTLNDLELLEKVRRTRRIADTDRSMQLLFQNFIACYPNDHVYFRPHELLVGWVESESIRLAALDASDDR